MRERPILFSASMVRAILEDRKTMTRRIMKPQTMIGDDGLFNSGCLTKAMLRKVFQAMPESFGPTFFCPYGQPGDRLWVRETFQPILVDGVARGEANYKTGEGYAVSYPATDGRIEFVDSDDEISDRCKPGIHMPRWASRILLEIESTRVERLQEITEEDSVSEGIQGPYGSSMGIPFTARDHFQALWESINGEESWTSNPWVWVVGFRRVEVPR